MPKRVIQLAVFIAMLAGLRSAYAQQPSPTTGFSVGNVTCQMATALTAFQLNLKTLDYERVAFMAGWGCTYRGLAVPLGVAAYVGAGVSKSHPDGLQGNLLFSVADYGAVGPGVQLFKDPVSGDAVWQGLLSVSLNYNDGASLGRLLKLSAAKPSS